MSATYEPSRDGPTHPNGGSIADDTSDTGDKPDKPDKYDTPITGNTLEELKGVSERYNLYGAILFSGAVLVGIGLLCASYYITELDVAALKESGHNTATLILLLVRGTLFGGLSIAVLYGVLTVATGFVDQAARYRKRLYSAHMINYALRHYHDQIQSGDVKLGDVVALFNAWNESVESAFSSIRFQKKAQSLEVGGKNFGVAVREPEQASKKGAPEERP